uniref:Uncharacterized protein n=1 Tax=Panagrellus redivivus TaxID=6233 RepID=A0A7E4VPV9_PANRE
MPYPILKLPYGFQQRLRGLATPKERYNVQVAVGLGKNYLGPLQMCFRDSECSDFRLKQFQIHGNDGLRRDAENDNLFILEGTLRIYSFKPSDYYDHFYDHFLIKSDAFLMAGMEHPDVPQKLAKLCDPNLVTYLTAGTCRSDVNLDLIVDNFKNIEFIDIEFPDYQSNWMQDMLKFKNLKLTCLDIKSQFEKLFCFEPEELSQLYKNLPPTFRLILSCNKPPENASELVRQKLGPHFKEINSESRNTGGYDGFLIINLHDFLCFEVIEQTTL